MAVLQDLEISDIECSDHLILSSCIEKYFYLLWFGRFWDLSYVVPYKRHNRIGVKISGWHYVFRVDEAICFVVAIKEIMCVPMMYA